MIHVRNTMSTLGDIMNHVEEYHEYIRGCSRDNGGYHEYTKGRSVHRRDTKMHVGNIMIHVGGHHEYIGVFNINQRLLSICSPT